MLGPACALRMNPARDGESRRVDMKDGDFGKLVAVRIEELVVVNVVILTEDPLSIGTQVGLRRLPLDLVVQRFLALVGVRQIELVGEKKPPCQKQSGH